jgi:hypothetical protein
MEHLADGIKLGAVAGADKALLFGVPVYRAAQVRATRIEAVGGKARAF